MATIKFLDIPENSRREKKTRNKVIAKLYTFQANAKKTFIEVFNPW